MSSERTDSECSNMPRRGHYTSNDQGFLFHANTSFKDIHSSALSSPHNGQPFPNDTGGFVTGDHSMAPSHHGYFNNFPDFSGQGTVEDSVYLPDDHTRLNGLRDAPFPINRFLQTRAQDAPWTGLRHGAEHSSLSSLFGGYRTSASFTAHLTVPSVITPSDSGYETQPRKSVGAPSVHGDTDLSGPGASSQLLDMQLDHESVYDASNTHAVGQSTLPWGQGILSELPLTSSNETTTVKCDDCPDRTFKSMCELKKHVNRHKRPHRCPETTCDYNKKGFGTANDLDRHMQDVHDKAGTRYRCHHGQCQTKVKDWSRADNFRNHLKTLHHIIIDRKDGLEEYIVYNQSVALAECPASTQTTPMLRDTTLVPRDAHAFAPSTAADDSRSTCAGVVAHGLTVTTEPLVLGLPGLEKAPSQCGECPSEWVKRQSEQGNLDYVHTDGCGVKRTLQGIEPSNIGHRADSAPEVSDSPQSQLAGVDPYDFGSDGEDKEENDSDAKRNDEAHTTIDLTHDEDTQNMRLLSAASVGQGSLHSSQATNSHRLSSEEVSILKPHTRSLDKTGRDIGSDSYHTINAGPSPAFVEANSTTTSDLDFDNMDQETAEIVFLKLMAKIGDERVQRVLRRAGHGKQEEMLATSKKTPSAESPKPNGTVKCTHGTCGKAFQRKSEMKKHLKRHSKPYWCTQCLKHFGSKNDWIRHENSQHSQHDLWQCDLLLEPPVDVKCNKVCHRRGSFKLHLTTHHQFHNGTQLEEKLDTCRVQQGETRFWCGFCKEIVECKQTGADVIKGRFNHIDDHNHGRNGLVKKRPEDWQKDDVGSPEPARSPVRFLPLKGGTKDTSRKRKEHGKEPATKRVKTQPSGQLVRTWRCCQCDEGMLGYVNNPSCINCGGPRCAHCSVDDAPVNELEVLPAPSG